MTNTEIIQVIKTEIDALLSAHDKVDHLEAFEVGKAWNRGHKQALENLKSFIDSLQQEQPSEDLEEAANRFAQSYDMGTCDGIAQDCFIAGAEWQKKQQDLALTWQDIMSIATISRCLRQSSSKYLFLSDEEYYGGEVLKRFNKWRKQDKEKLWQLCAETTASR